jgi:methylenetetrahydrofolate--tRNA-(uracil-5-)-methyltransferase
MGALCAYLRDATPKDFQPQNVTFAYFAPLPDAPRDKKARRRALADRALAEIDRIAAELLPQRRTMELS